MRPAWHDDETYFTPCDTYAVVLTHGIDMYTHSTISGPSSPTLAPVDPDDARQDMAPAENLRVAVAQYLGPRDDPKRKCLTQRLVSVIATLHATGATERYAGREARLFDEVVNYLDRPPHQYAFGTRVALALARSLNEEARPGQAPTEIVERVLRSLPAGFGFPHAPEPFLAQLLEQEGQLSGEHDTFIKRAGRMAVLAGVELATAHEREDYAIAAEDLLSLAARWEQQPWAVEFAEPWRALSETQRDTPLDLPPSVTLKLERTRSWLIHLQNQLCDPGRRGIPLRFHATDIECIDGLLGSGAAAAAVSRATPLEATAARPFPTPVSTPFEEITVGMYELLNQLNAALGHTLGLLVDVAPRTATGASPLEMAIESWYSNNVDAQSEQWRKFSERDGAQEFALFLSDLFLRKDAYPQWDLDAAVPAALATFVAHENLVDQVFAAVKTRVDNIGDGTMEVFQVVNQILDTQRARTGRQA